MSFIQTQRAVKRAVSSPVCTVSKQARWVAPLALPLIAGPLWCLLWRSQDLWLGTLSGFVLLCVLATSAVTDLRNHRIYNWATYSAFVWALTINMAASLQPPGESVLNRANATLIGADLLGNIGIAQCLAGAALCLCITLAGYYLSGCGAGDVKLATVIGALLGAHQGVNAVAYSYIAAAVAIVVWSAWENGPLAIAKAAVRTIGNGRGPLWSSPPTSTDALLLARPIPLGPYFAIGTLLVVLGLVP